jgi:heme exporter protein C
MAKPIESILSLQALTGSFWARALLPALAILTTEFALYLALIAAPAERVMGDVQRIFYFHLGTAIATYVMVGVLFTSSVMYLASRKRAWELLGVASCSVALVFATIVLATGMIWGHSAWNTWWRWEPRLVSFLVLWMVLAAYPILRSFVSNDNKQGLLSAVFGIFAALNVPIVMFSIRLWSRAEQLHPEVVGNQGLSDPRYVAAMIMGMVSMIIVAFWLCAVRYANLLLAEKLAAQSD